MKGSQDQNVQEELYFAYGSNMDRVQLERRVGEVDYVGIGQLDDHKLVFNRKGSYRPGGVASVMPALGQRVFGVIWRLTPEALRKLDIIEDPKAYVRDRKEVVTAQGTSIMCYVYLSIPEGETEPDVEYLAILIAAAEKAGLPQDYVRILKSHRAVPTQARAFPIRSQGF